MGIDHGNAGVSDATADPWDTDTVPSFTACRRAAAAVRRAESGAAADVLVRPRGVSGIHRSRPPLAVVLYLAGQRGHLVWIDSQTFAMFAPPSATYDNDARLNGRIRWLVRLDRAWDVLVFGVPPFIALFAAAGLVAVPPLRVLAALLVVAASGYVGLLMATGVAWMVWRSYRTVEARVSRPLELAGDELLSRHWTLALCHAADVRRVPGLVREAHFRVVTRVGEGRSDGEIANADTILLCPDRAFTTHAAKEAAAAIPGTVWLGGVEPVHVVGANARFEPPVVHAAGSPRGITFALAGSATVLALVAAVVTIVEASHCASRACPTGLTNYFDALYWLFSRVVGAGDPAGLAPATTGVRLLGLLSPVNGVVMLGCVVVAVWRYLALRHSAKVEGYRAIRTMAQRPPTIGIVTALPVELAAMRAILDDPWELHEDDDRAGYVGGKLPSAVESDPHSVVLTLMTETGTNAAATACTNLARTYRTVNCVIMVGVAAGVPNLQEPSKHVRLGDVVAADWGIVDFDNVDELADWPELRGGFPQPSALLKGAAGRVQAKELIGQRPWEQWLDITGKPALAIYGRPADDTDVVYDDEQPRLRLAHPDPRLSGHRPGVPKIHYGLIGSADRSWRNAKRKNAIAARYNLRAFEMEAEGIGRSNSLNGLEWYVVRGISDYGDEHTDTTWRPYAALAAAAYVRALLAETAAIEPRGGQSRGDRG